MDLFSLVGKVAIDTSDARNALQDTVDEGDTTQTSLESSFSKIGSAVTKYFTAAAIISFGKAIVDLATDAETAAAKVKTLLSDNVDTETYFAQMVEASNATGVALADYEEAVYSAISAGVDEADAIAFVTESVKLAKGGFTDAGTSVDVLTTALKAYGGAGLTASKVSDILITTQNLGKTTVDELASSMGRVIPLAASYNVNLENLGAAYATLTGNGIATAEATTYLKSMMSELTKESSKVSGVLIDSTGMSFSQLMASGYSLGEVLQIISNAVDGDATAFGNLWSSTEAGTGAMSILNAGTEAYNSTLAQMENSSGAVEKAYGIMNDTTAATVQRAQTKIENAGVKAGEALLPVISEMIDKLEPLLTGTLPQLAELFGTIIEIISPILDVILDIIQVALIVVNEIIGAIAEALKTIADFFGMGNIEENRAEAIAQLEAQDNRTAAERMNGKYAGYDFDQQSAIFDYLLATSNGWSTTDEEQAMLDVGISQESIDMIKQDISAVLSEDSGFDLALSDAWFEETVQPELQEELDEMPLTATVGTVNIDTSAITAAQAQLAGYSFTVNSATGSGEPQANGLDFVSRDGMMARLHYGEAVLNRTEAREWRDGSGNGALYALSEKFDRLMDVLADGASGRSTNIVLDTGVLVGSLSGGMDDQLGRIASVRSRRG